WRSDRSIAAITTSMIVALPHQLAPGHIAAARDPAKHRHQNDPKRRVGDHVVSSVVPPPVECAEPPPMLHDSVSHASVALPQRRRAGDCVAARSRLLLAPKS